MNARLHPAFAQALEPFAPPPVIRTADFCTAMRRWSRSAPSHSELVDVFFVMASTVKANNALSDKCCASVVDQLQELANEVDQDAVNQRAEFPDCGVSPALREIEKLIEAFPTKLERQA